MTHTNRLTYPLWRGIRLDRIRMGETSMDAFEHSKVWATVARQMNDAAMPAVGESINQLHFTYCALGTFAARMASAYLDAQHEKSLT